MASDTPPTGTAVPRPGTVVEAKLADFPQGPRTPTLREIYELIDQRLSPEIVQRVSSLPPPAPRQSLPVRAAKTTGRWGRGFITITGGIMLLLQGVAWFEEYRGPIQQGVAIAGKVLDLWEANRLTDDLGPPTRSMPAQPDAGKPE